MNVSYFEIHEPSSYNNVELKLPNVAQAPVDGNMNCNPGHKHRALFSLEVYHI